MEVTLASKSGSLAKAADVFAVYYIPSAVVEVTSGENAGQRLVFFKRCHTDQKPWEVVWHYKLDA